jgi:hypothetical protein
MVVSWEQTAGSRQRAAGSGQQAPKGVLLKWYGFLALQPDSLGHFQIKPRRLQGGIQLNIAEGYLIYISKRIFSLDADHQV